MGPVCLLIALVHVADHGFFSFVYSLRGFFGVRLLIICDDRSRRRSWERVIMAVHTVRGKETFLCSFDDQFCCV